jgi:regulator of sigma E protease
MLTILGAVAVITLVILTHEMGHYVTAKRLGVIVEEFGFGFPPRLLRLWRDRAAIYVQGERLPIDKEVEIPEALQSRCTVHYETRKDNKGRSIITKIDVVDPKEVAGATFVEKYDPGTEYTINAIPFLAFVRLLGEDDPTLPGSLAAASKRVRFTVLFGGPAMNLLMALVLFIAAFMVGWPEPTRYGLLVAEVAEGSPAEAAELQVEDIILSIDGHITESVEQLHALTDERLDQLMTMEVQRQGQVIQVSVRPRSQPPEGEGPIGVGIIGEWVVRIEPKRYPLGQAIVRGTAETGATIAMVAIVPIQIIRGLIPIEQARPTGIVGIARMTADAVEQTVDTGWLFPIVQMMAAISIALGITNLLPIPAFDGGRLLFVFLEALRGKRIPPEREGAIHLIGLTALLALMLVITYFDLTKDIPTMDWRSLLP